MPDWSDAAAACPSNFSVCTAAERGYAACDTGRPVVSCNRLDCDGGCQNDDGSDEWGWVADASESDPRRGLLRRETTAGFISLGICSSIPVWCCRDR